MLVEVLISAMIVALMAAATVTGFTALNKQGVEERHRNEAAVLAAQSQESMRSDPVSTLLSFKEEGGNSYTAAVAGTTYTIVQTASFGNGSEATGCSATESSKGQGTYVRITSTVSWTHMVVKPVSEASIITPPTGSAIDIEASNGQTPTSGVPVVIKYVPSGSSTSSSLEGTTSSSGCVLFAGIPATEATVEVREAAGIVNRRGTQSWPNETVTLAPNVLTRHQLKLAHAGRVNAEFTYRGLSKDSHNNNAGTETYEESVTGDTFVVSNAEMEQLPNWEEGSTTAPEPFTGALFEIVPAKLDIGYQPTAPSPTEVTRYPQGDLFPFPSPKNWTAWAGDCLENKPELYDASVTAEAKTVPPGGPVTIKVPTTYVMLNVYSKSEAEVNAMSTKGEPTWTALETATADKVTITNKKCESITAPDNETAVSLKHVQETTTGGEWGGHLTAPFQPFGEYELCLAGNGKLYRPKKQPYINTNPEKPVTLNIYLNELSHSEIKTTRETKEKQTQTERITKETEIRTAREASELATKTKRVASEAETRSKREATEKETKVARESSEAVTRKEREKAEATEKETKTKEEATKAERLANEKKEKEAWESEVSKNGKPKTTKEKEDKEKEEKQATKRKASEATEKTAAEKRESEEKATSKKKTEEESAKKAAETKELEGKTKAEAKETETRKAEETTETTTKTTAEAKETTTRKAAETEEAKTTSEAVKTEEKLLSEKEDVVESGASC